MAGTISIKSNLAARSAERHLARTSSRLENSLTQLASGLRINKASDDAAALAIGMALKLDTRVFSQAVRNVNDGINLINIADGALGELSGIVIRIRELATQAANGVLNNRQREALDAEAQALSKEYTRIARSTKFNGRALFDADFGELTIQEGYGLSGATTSSLGGAIGTGSYAAAVGSLISSNAQSAASADLNRDGALDVVVADGLVGGTASVLLGNGDGTFYCSETLSMGPNMRTATISDFNADDCPDIITGDFQVYLGKGDGRFNYKCGLLLGVTSDSIAAKDFNEDGVIDVAAASGSMVRVFLGRGDGTFKAENDYSTGGASGARFVVASDFNRDGALDLVTANQLTDNVGILLGNGDGSFRAATSYTAGDSPKWLAVADFNGDTAMDVACADALGGSVSVLLGNGDGTLKPRTVLTTGTTPYSVVAGDVSGDGIMDLVSADVMSLSISTFLGRGDGTFEPRTILSTVGRPYCALLNDFTGDGVLDIGAVMNNLQFNVYAADTKPGVGPLLPFSLREAWQAVQALSQLDQALDRISQQRGTVGAFQSRLEVAAHTLETSGENFRAAEGRIMDADVADSAAQLVKDRILQQVGTSILAQAKQQPSLALSLLGNL